MMYKKYSIPFSLNETHWEIHFLQNEKIIYYKRKCNDAELEKKLLTSAKTVNLQPVEPLNYPKVVTDYLLIELQEMTTISPFSKHTIFLTFPIEIGVFLPNGKEWQMLDVLSLPKTKFTLYGDPAHGVICKHWSSSVMYAIPEVNPIKEGVLRLEINNQSDEWQNVQKILLKADSMKLFFNEKLVSMHAQMKILSAIHAEITFMNLPLQKNMEKAIEIFSQKRLALTSSKTFMFEGI